MARARSFWLRASRLPAGAAWHRGAGLTALLVATALFAALLAPVARADDLTDQRDHLKQQIARTRTDLNESSSTLTSAAVAVDQAQGRLDAARATLATTRAALAGARSKDAAMAARLKQAQGDLAAAKAAVEAGQAKLDAAKTLAGQIVRDQYQQQTNLMPIAVLTDPRGTGDLATRVQWATTMFDTTQATIDHLSAAQQLLTAERARQATLETQVAQDRQAAAAGLATTRQLEARAETDAASVAGLLSQRQAAERSAASDVAADRAQYASLVKERTSVEHRIVARIAAAKAAAAEKAAAERAAAKAAAEKAAARAAAQERQAAREKAAAKTARARAAADAAEKQAKRAVARARSRKSGSSSSSGGRSSSSAHHGFIYPVHAAITSPYGMRFHPILHVWKLHDGTDFGAGCGTPIKAAYDGTVEEKYFNEGYGNRLFIDHGKVDGVYVTTSYNHAIRYVVGVGDHVRQGQTIGYVGETGYATGCHLHLMVYLDGKVVDPMTWY